MNQIIRVGYFVVNILPVNENVDSLESGFFKQSHGMSLYPTRTMFEKECEESQEGMKILQRM